MKKLMAAILVVMLWAAPCLAAGTATATGPTSVTIDGTVQRREVTITWTGDAAAGGHVTYTLNPATFGITGWYLYEAVTNPGSTAPDDNYDIAITDADAADLVSTDLNNRSATASQRVRFDSYYPQIWNSWTLTVTNDNNLSAVIVLKLRFTTN